MTESAPFLEDHTKILEKTNELSNNSLKPLMRGQIFRKTLSKEIKLLEETRMLV